MWAVSGVDIITVLFASLFLYSAYTLAIVVIGGTIAYREIEDRELKTPAHMATYPFISVILPVKNEATVVSRVIEGLLHQAYPATRFEIIIVEDGSTDQTPSICHDYADRYPTQIQYIHRAISDGKPSALNVGLRCAQGEIVSVFDADNVPAPSLFTYAAKRFEDPDVVALQGQLKTLNAHETMLAHLVHYERQIQLHLYALGKARLGLFVPFAGTNLFIRRAVLEQVGAWHTNALSEDVELAAKLIHRQQVVTYAPELVAWQENPATYRQFMTQRTRWYRGCMEVALQYGKLLKHPSHLNVDTELFLFGPFTLMLALVTGMLYSILNVLPVQFHAYTTLIAQSSCVLGGVLITLGGVLLAHMTKPWRLANLKWLPLLYLYCALQGVIATCSFFQIVFHRPRKWIRTSKTGWVPFNNAPLSASIRHLNPK